MKIKYFYYLLFIISLIIAGYSYYSISKVYDNRTKLYDARDRLKGLKDENRQLKEELAYRKTEEFVVKEAREKLNFGYEGEKIYIVPDVNYKKEKEIEKKASDKTLNEMVTEQNIPIYMQWFKTFF